MKKIFLFLASTLIFFSCESETKDGLKRKTQTKCSGILQAALDNDVAKMKQLIEKGCDANARIVEAEKYWEAPLRHAVHHENPEMIKLLLSNGADPNIDLERNISPFHYAAGTASIDILKLLHEKGGDVNTFNPRSNYNTPLIFSIAKDKKENTKWLIENGAEVNPILGKYKSPPLSMAVSKQDLALVKMLLEKGAKINRRYDLQSEDCISCPEGISALHTCINVLANENEARAEGYQILELLVSECDTIDLTNAQGETPLYLAAYSENIELVDLLIENGAKIELNKKSALHAAVLFSNTKMVKHLLELDADPNFKSDDEPAPIENTPLMISYFGPIGDFSTGITRKNKLETAILLIKHGAEYNVKEEGMTYLEIINEGFRDSLIQRGIISVN